MKRCDNKLITKRRKRVENVTEEEGRLRKKCDVGLCIDPCFELYTLLRLLDILYEIKLKVTVKPLIRALTVQYRVRINK